MLEFNEQSAKELHKPIIRKFKKRKVCSGFKDNILGADLADMQLISKLDFNYVLLISLINMFGLFLWKMKKVLVLLMLFKRF